MNTEAQRARNARKRAKARAKKRAARLLDSPVAAKSCWRIKFEGELFEVPRFPKGPKGLLWRASVIRASEGLDTRTFDTQWEYTCLHDLSTSICSLIECAVNTYRTENYGVLRCIVQRDGRERRYVWQGHTKDVGAAEIAAVVCLLKKQTFNEE